MIEKFVITDAKGNVLFEKLSINTKRTLAVLEARLQTSGIEYVVAKEVNKHELRG